VGAGPGSGVRNSSVASLEDGFAVSGNQFLRVNTGTGLDHVTTVIWEFKDANVFAFGSFFTGFGVSPSSLTLLYTDGTNSSVYSFDRPHDIGFFVGFITETAIKSVVLRVENLAETENSFSIDLSISAIRISPINTTKVGNFVVVNNLNAEIVENTVCEKGVTWPVATRTCQCYGTHLADLTAADLASSTLRSKLSGTEKCEGETIFKTFWMRSFNGDSFQNSPLVLTFPSVTVGDINSDHGVLCNAL